MHFTGLLKVIVRNFRKNITVSLIKAAGLAISIAAVIIIWSYVINENKYDSSVPESDRIFRLDAHWASLPSFLGHALNQNTSSQVVSTRLNFWQDVGIQINSNPFNLKELLFADSTFFKVFQFDLKEGKAEEALIRPFSLVLSESTARRLFGETDPLGKIVRFQNQWDFTVTGIMKDRPFLHFRTDVIASIVSLEYIRYKGVLKEYDGWNFPTYLILPKDIPIAESKKAVLDLLKKVGYNDPFRLKPFSTIYYSSEVENESNTKHGNLLYNRILIAVSIFILLLAAINFINLTIANALARSKEVSLKKLQGAHKSQLILQFLIETVFFILISIALSFLLLWFVEPVLSSLTGFSVSIGDFFTHYNILKFSIAVIAFIIITGIYPSIYISSYNINSNKEGFPGHSNHIGIRNGLIVFQNLVSITLISCTLFANQQFQFMKKKDLGFNKNEIINLKINSQLSGHLESFRETLLKNPEVISVSYSSRIPGNYWGSWCCVNIEGKENKFFNNYVDPYYLKTMGIRIKDGRNFSSDNQADINATYLINETAIRLYNIKNPIGQVIVPGNGVKGQITGIIKDFHYRGLNYEQSPLLLFNTINYLNYINIKVDSRNIPGALEKIKEGWIEICPAFSFEYSFLDETYDMQYRSEKRFENLLFAFTLLAIFIASIGLFGLSIYSTEHRTKEIGIRKINGAKVSEVMLMLNAGLLKWITISFVLACPISWYAMNKWLQTFAYKTDLSLWIFGLAGIIAFGTAILTVSWQSWRAATRNPVDALRYE